MNTKHSLSAGKIHRSRQSHISSAIIFIATSITIGGGRAAIAGESLHVVERETTNTNIHLGAKGESDSVGDMIVFANPIFDSTNVHQLGVVQGDCVRIIVGKSWECFFTLVLANDRITLEGSYADAGESVFAITGGTGRYAGAKGQMSLRVRDSRSGGIAASDMTYDIL